jgi:hypothetical protein
VLSTTSRNLRLLPQPKNIQSAIQWSVASHNARTADRSRIIFP